MPVNKEHAFGGGVVYHSPAMRRQAWARGLFRDPVLTLKLVISHYTSPVRSRVASAWRQIGRVATCHETVRIGPSAWFTSYTKNGNRRNILVDEGSIVRGLIRIEAGGKVEISKHVYIGDDVIISSSRLVKIGANTSLAHGVHVFDNDSHPLGSLARRRHTDSYYRNSDIAAGEVGSAEVVIGEDVWIGFNAFIAKGVSIGDGSVVAACSVVTASVPPGVLVAGNPAREIRTLEQ